MNSSNNDTATELSMSNRILLHNSMLDVTLNEYMTWLKVQTKPGQEELSSYALQDEFKDYDLLCIVDGNALHVGVRATKSDDFNHKKLHAELTDLLVSPERKQPSSIDNINILRKLTSIVTEQAKRAYSEIICMESEFIEGFYWLSRAFRDASTLLKGEELQFFLLEELLSISDDFDNLIKRMGKKSVVLTAVCLNEMNEQLQEIYPHHPAPIDPDITGDLAKSVALGKGAAYYHPTPGYDDFLAYCSWRFHEPIPIKDLQSIKAIFTQLSDLGLPTSRYFLELRDLDQDSVFTVFSTDYADWCEEVWYE